MPNRGGARHIQKPWVDAGLLHTCFSKHKGLVSNMHAYEHISSGNAPDPKALLSLQALWVGLVALQPSAQIHPQPIRQALLSLLGEFPELNTSKHTGEVWCNLKVERLNCMLAHVRKLARPNADIGPVVGKLTSAEYVKLKAGFEQLQLEGLEKPTELPVEKAPAEALEKASSSSHQQGEKSGKAKRKLTTHISDVTVDSDGLPQLFKSPDPKTMKRPASALEKAGPALEKAGPAEDLQLVSLQRPGSRLHEAMGYGLKKPKAKAKARPRLIRRSLLPKPLERSKLLPQVLEKTFLVAGSSGFQLTRQMPRSLKGPIYKENMLEEASIWLWKWLPSRAFTIWQSLARSESLWKRTGSQSQKPWKWRLSS